MTDQLARPLIDRPSLLRRRVLTPPRRRQNTTAEKPRDKGYAVLADQLRSRRGKPGRNLPNGKQYKSPSVDRDCPLTGFACD